MFTRFKYDFFAHCWDKSGCLSDSNCRSCRLTHDRFGHVECRLLPTYASHLRCNVPAFIAQIDIQFEDVVRSLAACSVTHPGKHLPRTRRYDPQRFQSKRQSRLPGSGPPSINPTATCSAPSIKLGCRT